MPVEKVANQIVDAIRKQKSKVYVTKRWHVLAIINKNLPFSIYKKMCPNHFMSNFRKTVRIMDNNPNRGIGQQIKQANAPFLR